ncbi:MAG: HPr family phosphocarrier protein [Clostridiales bacterium]|nr:HPr family phosphocarrier protein [Clostridiales bacterium]MCD8239583.1 HPr family phosphocarrier protein [Clostridiales bacterium]
MKEIKINVDSINKVKEFVNILNTFDGDFDLVTDRYVVDAKSIMGIFSLDISKDITLAIHDNAPADKVVAALAKFIA